MPYLWQGALSIVSQTLLLMGATMSPSLSAIINTLVPHHDAIDQIINNVVVEIERYAHLAPSLSLSSEIIREAELRRRSYLHSGWSTPVQHARKTSPVNKMEVMG